MKSSPFPRIHVQFEEVIQASVVLTEAAMNVDSFLENGDAVRMTALRFGSGSEELREPVGLWVVLMNLDGFPFPQTRLSQQEYFAFVTPCFVRESGQNLIA